MKKLEQLLDLNNTIETITMMELRKNPGEIITNVMLGRTYIISKNNRNLAVLQKLPGDRLSLKIDKKGNFSYV